MEFELFFSFALDLAIDFTIDHINLPLGNMLYLPSTNVTFLGPTLGHCHRMWRDVTNMDVKSLIICTKIHAIYTLMLWIYDYLPLRPHCFDYMIQFTCDIIWYTCNKYFMEAYLSTIWIIRHAKFQNNGILLWLLAPYGKYKLLNDG